MVRIKSPQDFGAAVLLLVIGLGGAYFASDLHFGTAARMGTGYFPTILSWMIAGMGLFIGFKSLAVAGPEIPQVQIRPILVIIIAALIFGYAIEVFGVAIASTASMIVASYARRKATLGEAIILAICITAFAIVVFVWALGQPLPLWWGR